MKEEAKILYHPNANTRPVKNGYALQRDRIVVAKIGGSTLGSHDTTLEDVVRLRNEGYYPVVVHGGGKVITDWLAKQQIPTTFARGLRVTDERSLEVVVAVLAGLINTDLVANLNRLGGQACGLSGVDGALLVAEPEDPALGLVGKVVTVNTEIVDVLLAAHCIPVVAPIGVSAAKDGAILYNINADTVAGQLAAALGAGHLVFLTDVAGILGANGRLCLSLLPEEAEQLIASGVANGGMIPKIEACLAALTVAETASIVDGREPEALFNAVQGQPSGTVLKKG